MKKIGIFYGPASGSTERAAKKIAIKLGEDNADLILVKNATVDDIEKYENIIFGISTIGKETWSSDSAASDWDVFMPNLDKINFTNKTIALFGLGDHISYAQYFVDAMGILGEKLTKINANLVGYCDTEGYEFEDSKAIVNGKFCGLPIDEDFEEHLTDERISHWIDRIKPDFK